MNERIRELMLLAISEVDNVSGDPDGDLHRMYIPNVFAEKFAELLVRDCMNAAQRISELRGATEEHIYGADTACVLISKLYEVKL